MPRVDAGETRERRPGPLAGLSVVDLSRYLPGPFATLLLADLGADVISVEETPRGEPLRSFPPFRGGTGVKYLGLGRNKRSLALDLKRPEGREILLRLAVAADVFVESFRPGVTRRLGIDYETLSPLNPRLIYCSISGYGQDGPMARAAGHDLNYLAVAGLLSLWKEPDVPGVQIADIGGGALMAAVGILAALRHRDRTGEGQYVDISMTDGALAWSSLRGADYLLGEDGPGESPISGYYPCYGLYQAGDGRWLALGALEPHFWRNFCLGIGRSDLIAKQFPEGEDRVWVLDEVRSIIRSKTAREWLERFERLDACLTLVYSLPEAFDHPQIAARGMVVEAPGPSGEPVRQIACPIKLSRTPAAAPGRAPALGEHTSEVLEGLGFDPSEVQRLRGLGVIV